LVKLLRPHLAAVRTTTRLPQKNARCAACGLAIRTRPGPQPCNPQPRESAPAPSRIPGPGPHFPSQNAHPPRGNRPKHSQKLVAALGSLGKLIGVLWPHCRPPGRALVARSARASARSVLRFAAEQIQIGTDSVRGRCPWLSRFFAVLPPGNDAWLAQGWPGVLIRLAWVFRASVPWGDA
jgi:hypothetical protein